MEYLLMFSFFCLLPMALIVFGFWLGKGAPGWPWALVERDRAAGAQTPYHNREEVYHR